MVKRKDILDYLEEVFSEIKINDYSYNGLQFEGAETINKIASGVDANNEFFLKAAQAGAQFAMVHHGIFWKGGEWVKIDRYIRNTFDILHQANLNLYASHLPLDLHPIFGNNVLLAKELDAKVQSPFGGKAPVGVMASFSKPLAIGKFLKIVENKIGNVITHLDFGKKTIKNVGIVSGGGWSSIADPLVYSGEIDLILTGEIIHQAVSACKERNIHMVSAGHYNTEVFGVRSLASHVAAKFKLEHVFIDLPTGL